MNLLNNGQYFKIVPRFVVVKLLKGVVEIIKANKTVDGSVFYEHFLPMSDAIIDYFSVIIVECTLKLLHRANTYTQADNRKILKIRDIFAALVADKGDSNPCFPTDVSEAFNTRGIRYLGEYIVPGKVNEGAMDLVVDKKILRSVRTLTIKQPNSRK
jgi:histone H3/H4